MLLFIYMITDRTAIKYNNKCNHNINVPLYKQTKMCLHFIWNLNFIENQPSVSFSMIHQERYVRKRKKVYANY